MKKNTAEEFWRQVDRSGECWLWQGRCQHKGYGLFTWQGRTQGAHRISMQLAGLDPNAVMVCHHCDEPRCVNPQHLFLGTAKTNNDDKISKGRHCYGEQHPLSKLTAEQVGEIRQRLKDYVPRRRPSLLEQLADEYGVDVSKIKQIKFQNQE